MKKLKQLLMCLSAFILCAGFVLAGSVTAEASSKDVPSKAYILVGTEGGFWFTFDSAGSKITNLKSNSKNFVVKVTNYSSTECGISYYAKKAGSYKITFTIKPKSGKSIKKTVKVTAGKVDPIKKVTFGGKQIPIYTYWNSRALYTTAKSGKLSVSMNKGFKIKKIRVGTLKKYKKGKNTYTDVVFKTVKNNSKISLGNVYKTGDETDIYDSFSSKYALIEIQYTSPYCEKVQYEYANIYKI